MGAKTISSSLVAFGALAGFLGQYPDRAVQLLSRFRTVDRDGMQEALAAAQKTETTEGTADIEVSKVGFVLVASPRANSLATSKGWLESWISSQEGNRWLKDAFFKHGAVILRGFNVPRALDFENVSLAITPKLQETYLGTSPRSQISGTKYVHTAADFKQHFTVPPHLEMSFKDDPPRVQMFYAAVVKHTLGGESPLVDFRAVWRTIKANTYGLAQRIEGRKLKYIRRYEDCGNLIRIDPWISKCWQDMFRTSNKTEVMRQCGEERFDCEWDESNTLAISNYQPFIRKHEISQDTTWFNHLNVLVPDSIIYDYERTSSMRGKASSAWRPLLQSIYYQLLLSFFRLYKAESELGHNVIFEDGSVIAREDFLVMKRAIWKHTVQAPYQLHDIVVLDNRRIAHGREMYEGSKLDRQIMTAWSDHYPSKWVSGASEPNPVEFVVSADA